MIRWPVPFFLLSRSPQNDVAERPLTPGPQPSLFKTRILDDLGYCRQGAEMEVAFVRCSHQDENRVNRSRLFGKSDAILATSEEDAERMFSIENDMRNRQARANGRTRFLLAFHQ